MTKETTLNASSVRRVAAIQRLPHKREILLNGGTQPNRCTQSWLGSSWRARNKRVVSLKGKFIKIRISSFVSRTWKVCPDSKRNPGDVSPLEPIPVSFPENRFLCFPRIRLFFLRNFLLPSLSGSLTSFFIKDSSFSFLEEIRERISSRILVTFLSRYPYDSSASEFRDFSTPEIARKWRLTVLRRWKSRESAKFEYAAKQ